jgi:hypothetical protein
MGSNLQIKLQFANKIAPFNLQTATFGGGQLKINLKIRTPSISVQAKIQINATYQAPG